MKLGGTTLSGGRHVRGIEGLRGLAAFSVLFHHVGTQVGGSGVAKAMSVAAEQGLTLFFVLSGFLLYQPFVKGVLEGQFPSVHRFFRNRVVRILPGYLAIFVLVAFVFGAAHLYGVPELHDGAVGYMSDPGAILANLFLVQTYFPQFAMTGIGPAWSLTVEILFYVALPGLAYIALVVARRINSHTALMLPAFLLIIIGLALSAWGFLARRDMSEAASFAFSWGNSWTAVVDRSFFAQADLFGYGMLAACIVGKVRVGHTGAPTRRSMLWTGGGAVLVGGIAMSGSLRGASFNAMGVACALLLLLLVLGQGRLAGVLEWAPLKFAGLISYSVYLWHVPVILWLKEREMLFAGQWLPLNFVLVAAVTTLLAAGTYYGVEAQANKLRASSKTSAGAPLQRTGIR